LIWKLIEINPANEACESTDESKLAKQQTKQQQQKGLKMSVGHETDSADSNQFGESEKVTINSGNDATNSEDGTFHDVDVLCGREKEVFNHSTFRLIIITSSTSKLCVHFLMMNSRLSLIGYLRILIILGWGCTIKSRHKM
jgi:hypothetical protein